MVVRGDSRADLGMQRLTGESGSRRGHDYIDYRITGLQDYGMTG